MTNREYLRGLYAEALRHAAEFERIKAQHWEPFQRSQADFTRSLQSLIPYEAASRQMAREIERMKEALQPALLAVQRALIDKSAFDRLHKDWDVRERQGAAILAEKGWWLTPDMPMTLLNGVVRLAESRKRRKINRLMCDYYGPGRIHYLVTKWDDQPMFRERRHIVLQALWAHKRKRWYLSIPILLTQIDGVLQDFAKKEGMPKRESVRKIAKALKLGSADSKDVISDTWLSQLDAIFGSGFYETKVRQKGLRRHAILHGHELRYASEVRSTQLFLQLSTIHWLIVEKSRKSKTKGKKTRKKMGGGAK